MNREQLKELGLTDEQIESVMKAHGKSINDTKEKADKVDALESQINDYKEQIEDRDNQLTELKKVDPEALQAEIERLEGENETTKTEYESKLEAQAFDHKLENSLTGANVKNAKAVRALLDMDLIKLKDGELDGLKPQLEALQESDDYLFEVEKEPDNDPQIVTPGNPDGGGTNPDNDPFAAKLAQYK